MYIEVRPQGQTIPPPDGLPRDGRPLLTSTQARQNRSTEASPSRSSSIALCRSSGKTRRSARTSSPSPPDASPWAAGAASSLATATGAPLQEAWLDEGPSRSLSIWERAVISTSHTSASFYGAFGGRGRRGSSTTRCLLFGRKRVWTPESACCLLGWLCGWGNF